MIVTAAFAPMEMRPVEQIPDGPQWQYEPKWDGFRCLAHRDGNDIALTSKNGQPLARYFPEVVEAVAAVPANHFSLDGELVVPSAGALSFDALQQRIHPAASRVQRLAHETPALLLTFDLLREEGRDCVALPLRERRPALERFAEKFGNGALRLSPATTDRAVVDSWFARVGGALDGVIAKRLDLPYASGSREAAVKIKKMRTADCVIGGFRYAAGANDRVGSLLLGLYDDDAKLDYIGFCSAFAVAERVALIERLAPYVGGTGFTGGAPGDEPSRWSRDPEKSRAYIKLVPALVLEVAFDQVTSGRIRHGTKPLRWRSDKLPAHCTLDQLAVAGNVLQLLDRGTMPLCSENSVRRPLRSSLRLKVESGKRKAK
jgi:ATP-dependent DNA ligase